jgi:hypothetical protein
MKFTLIVSLLTCCATCLVSCREEEESSGSDSQKPKEQEALPEVASRAGDEYIKALRPPWDRYNYYLESPSIECLMGFGDDLKRSAMRKPILTNAMILSVADDGAVHIKEHIVGGSISDYEDYLPYDPDPGEYLIGMLMPYGGWGIARGIGRPRFCCVMLSNDSFSYGYHGELTGEIESIRQRSRHSNPYQPLCLHAHP